MHRSVYLTLIFLSLFLLFFGQFLGGIPTETENQPELLAEDPVFTGEVSVETVELLAPEPGFWTRTASQGRVGPGDTLFTGPVSTEDITLEIQLLAGAEKAKKKTLPRRKAELHQTIGSLQNSRKATVEAMALILEEEKEEVLLQSQNRLSALSAQCTPVTAPVGGIFLPGGTYPVLGRIVTSETWELSLVLPFGLELEQQVSLRLLSGIFQNVTCTVQSAQWEEDGCHVLLVCGEELEQAAKIRNLTVKFLQESEIRGGNFVENRVYYTTCNFLWKGQCLCIP